MNNALSPKQLIPPHPEHLLLVSALTRPVSDFSTLVEQFLSCPNKTHLWDMAYKNKVQAVVGEIVKEIPGLSEESRWVESYEANQFRTESFCASLDSLSNFLSEYGISWIVLENGGLARALFPSYPGRFQFGDFDLLVHHQDLPKIDQVLIQAGCRRISSRMELDNGRVEYNQLLENGLELRLNVQTSLVARRWFSSSHEPDLTSLFSRSCPVADSAVRILDPEDFLLQLCIHNASHSYVRKPGIRLHMDIDWYLRSRPVNWDLFLQMVGDLDLRTAVYFALLIPKTIFSTEIPERVFQALRPSPRKERWFINFFARHKLLDESKEMGKMEYALFSILLYDRPAQAMRSIFPDRAWMRQRYGISRDYLLPVYHARRLFNLAFRRMKT